MVRRKSTNPLPLKSFTTAIEIPVLRGIQAGREYYTGMVQLNLLKKLFVREEEELPPELRAQRILNLSRTRKIRDYVVENPADYALNSLTVMIDSPQVSGMEFVPIQPDQDWGILRLDIASKFYICDGQHRTEGLILATADHPDLSYESVSVVFYRFVNLSKAQQVFHDLNAYAVKPSISLNMAYEHRSPAIALTKAVVSAIPAFARFTDHERTSLPKLSSKLFTLNGIEGANRSLLKNCTLNEEEKTELAIGFWKKVASTMTGWQSVCNKGIVASDARQNYVHSHAVTLDAIASLGWAMLTKSKWQLTDEVSDRLDRLKEVNWERSNPDWEDLFIFDGRIRKDRRTIVNFASYLNEKTKEEPNEGN